MKIVEDVRTFEGELPQVALTIGSFDGVHVGHRRIVETVLERARAAGGTAAVLTMRPHPREFFSPNHAPNLLTTDAMKMELFEALGVDVVFILPFGPEVARLDRRDFVEQIVVGRCHARRLVVGHDFSFGKDAEGDYHYLREVGPEMGFTVEQIAPVIVDGERVSSTLAREHVLEGNLDKTEIYLGRKYAVSGVVVTGRGVGTQLGFPTANVRPYHSAIPAQGVYIAEAIVGGGRYAAAVNIGIAPTVRRQDETIEAFLLDYRGDLVAQDIRLIFHRRLRPERKFPSYDALRAQIGKDVESVRAYFRETTPSGE